MYPNLYYFFRDVFGIKIDFLLFVNSFGFFVAVAFLVAAALLTHELRHKSKLGFFYPTKSKIVVGKPASFYEIAINFIIGFLLGYKIIALFFLGSEATKDTQAYIFSSAGSWPAGFLVGFLFAILKWQEGRKRKLAKPEERTIRIWPHDRVGEITIIALVIGLLGAKLFDIFENWSDFLKHSADYIFSGGGLTFYGGLICAALAIIIYSKKQKIPIRHLADAIAPSLMIAYAIGRIGCQVAGDGDWGIYNSAYKIDASNKIVAASSTDFTDSVRAHADFFLRHSQQLDSIPHVSFKKPAILNFLPNGFFAYNFPHNVNETGISMAGCSERYCNQLPVPVFPTPFYETLICTLLFFVLWMLRKRIQLAGGLFCLYLILNGVERFFIEKIRVNNRLNFFGLQPTQAEVISASLVLLGVVLWIMLRKKHTATNSKA